MWCQLGCEDSNCTVITGVFFAYDKKLVWSLSTLLFFKITTRLIFFDVSLIFEKLYFLKLQPSFVNLILIIKVTLFCHKIWFVFNIPSINCKTPLALVPSFQPQRPTSNLYSKWDHNLFFQSAAFEYLCQTQKYPFTLQIYTEKIKWYSLDSIS